MREVQISSLRERFRRRLQVDELTGSPVPVPVTVRASLAPARVLLVASDRRFRALAATLLSQRGHTVLAARGGQA